MQIQLNKYVAQSGLCSRRNADKLILKGEIRVNDEVITNAGHKVTTSDKISFKNKPLKIETKVYILLNKPAGYISTVNDENGRKTIIDIVKSTVEYRLYPIGRLDRATTGLIILTNDGNLSQKLAYPSYEVQKTYTIRLNKPLQLKDFLSIKNGLKLEDGFILVDKISYTGKNKCYVRIKLHSGKNHIIRRIFKHLDYIILELDRSNYANLTKKGLQPGQWRYLSDYEISNLMKLEAT